MSEKPQGLTFKTDCEECRESMDHATHYGDTFVVGPCGGDHLYECPRTGRQEERAWAGESSRA